MGDHYTHMNTSTFVNLEENLSSVWLTLTFTHNFTKTTIWPIVSTLCASPNNAIIYLILPSDYFLLFLVTNDIFVNVG